MKEKNTIMRISVLQFLDSVMHTLKNKKFLDFFPALGTPGERTGEMPIHTLLLLLV